MHSIVASFKKRPFLEQMVANSHGKVIDWSFMRLNFKTFDYDLGRGFGEPPMEKLGTRFKYDVPHYFYLGHIHWIEKEEDNNFKIISPLENMSNEFLYFGGEFKIASNFSGENFSEVVDYLSGKTTFIYINRFKKQIRVSKSPNVSLFVDKESSMSSVLFPKSSELENNFLYTLDFPNRKIIKI
jgi:hypothetical protein